MSQPQLPTAETALKWTAVQKIAFRFFFIFLCTTSIAGYNIAAEIFDVNYDAMAKWFSFLSKPLGWLDKHFYHIGFQPGKDLTFLADGRFGFVLTITLFILSALVTVAWSWADRKKASYNKLHYWFRMYLAYYLFLAMLIYAFEKIIPTQMQFPSAEALLTPLGEKNGFAMVWDFIGSRPAYGIFTGVCVLIGSLLFLFRRTRVFGSLFMTTVLVNVVCFNVFYNVPVKILSIQLLVITLFLLVPYVPKLVQFFYYWKPVSLAERKYVLTTKWKKYLLAACLLLIPSWCTFVTVKKTLQFQKDIAKNTKEQQLYNITAFISEKDTLLPLMTDTLRWKRLFFTNYRRDKYAVIYNMKDDKDYYGYTWDSAKKTITFIPDDTTKKYVFHYSIPAKNKLNIVGKWNGGRNLDISLDKFYTDSMQLITEKIRWIQKY